MLNRHYKYLLVALIFLGLAACSKANKDRDKPVEPTDSTGAPEQPDPTGSFDYAKMADHPRLLLQAGTEEKIQRNIDNNPLLKQVHEWILNFCDDLMGEPFYEFQEGSMATEARRIERNLFYLAYAYRMTHKKVYLARATASLNNVCDFPDWDPDRFLDVAELSMGVSLAYDWLYADLDEDTRVKVRDALIAKSITPFLSHDDWWLTNDGNWNEVSLSGPLCAALAVYEDNKQQSVEAIEHYLDNIHHSLDGYNPDGVYVEGYNYWTFGTWYQVLGQAALKSALGTDNGLAESSAFLKTARFFEFMEHPAVGASFDYSDVFPELRCNPFQFWFAQQLGDNSLLWNEKIKLEQGVYEHNNDESRMLPVLFVFTQDLDFSSITPPEQHIWIGKGVSPVVLIRTDWQDGSQGRYVGMKGGKAGNAHAHMDAGSFVFDANGVRWAMDLGRQSYGPIESAGLDLFDMSQQSDRWKLFRWNNYAHNTLTINNALHDVNGAATLLATYTDPQKMGGKFEMTPVFGGALKEATREVLLMDEDYLEVNDALTTGSDPALVTWRMCTSADARIVNDHTIELTKDNKQLLLIVDAPAEVSLKIWSNASNYPYDADNSGTQRVGFETRMEANEKVALQVRLVPQ